MSFAAGRPPSDSAPRLAFDVAERLLDDGGRKQPIVLLGLSGELDFASGPRLGERLSAHIAAGRRAIVIDLSALTFIDSMAIGVLVGAATRIGESGAGSLAAVCSGENERVLRIFDIAGVAEMIPLHRGTQEAIDAIATRARRYTPEPGVDTTALEQAPSRATPSGPGVTRSYAHDGAASGHRESVAGAPEGRAGRVDELA